MTGPAARAGYLRHPAISGETIVFCSEDDLWVVGADGGQARRLTAGSCEYAYPRVSADGASVAFTGADDGPCEVYAMPLAGGPIRRLTYQAARCVVAGWHPETGEILYASTAEQPGGFGHRLFAVEPTGGATRLLTEGPGYAAAFGPDGALVVNRSIADPARRKRYRGGAAGTLWIAPSGGEFRPLIELEGNLAAPNWIGQRVFFISDHEGVGNVYSCDASGEDLRRHTGHADYYARGLSGDGERLVYHCGADLYVLDDPEHAETRRLEIDTAGSRAQQARRFVDAAEYLERARLSPDGESLALVTRGRMFTLDHWTGPVREHNGGRDGVRLRLPAWLADGERLVAVAGDELPGERLVLLPADGGPALDELALDELGCVIELVASPAEDRIAFTTNRQQLWTVEVAAGLGVPRLLDTARAERIEDPAWSPDGRWLAYTYPDTARTSAIRVAEVASGRTYPITRPVLRDTRPAFDPEGRYLYFLGQRDLTPEHDQVQFDIGFPFGARPYLVTLRADEPQPFAERLLPQGLAEEEPGTAYERPAVEIDLAGIDRRVVALPLPEGRYAAIVGQRDSVLLLTVPVAAPDPEDPRAVPQGSVVRVALSTGEVTEDYIVLVDEIESSADCTVLLVRCDARLRVLRSGPRDPGDGYLMPGTLPDRRSGWIDLDRVVVPLDPGAEWRQMFREAWRLQRESFWSAGMAGVDWDAVYQRYLPLADRVAARSELSDLLWELQGELRTSHAYELGGDHRRPPEREQGFLGVDWDVVQPVFEAGTARFGIARILRGDTWNPEATSPCNRPGADVRPGDVVAAVNGRAVGSAGPGELLVGQAGHEVELTLLRPGTEPRRVTVRASASESRARYRDWVDQATEHVHAVSSGRIGYVHVPDMFSTGYADFVRGFLTELDREGLLVDVRFNGGGHISPLLLDRLTRRRVGAEHGRWSGVAPYPLEAPNGPMALLINEQTGSDGEIFSHLFRSLGLGPLIGTRTWGGTIATWPRHRLVDGTVTTQPEFRYFLSGEGDGLENRGVEPDVTVEDPPRWPDRDVDGSGEWFEDEELRGDPASLGSVLAAGRRDAQLTAAVHGLLDVLGPAAVGAASPSAAMALGRAAQRHERGEVR
jgi:tricorn protease